MTSPQKKTADPFSEIYQWVDQVQLTRPKKSIARDFCDAVLVAEVIKHFQPKLIDIHNYPPACNLKQKFTNWTTLNKKVLIRLQIVLAPEQIEDLVNAKPLKIEKFLSMLRPKLESFKHESIGSHQLIPHLKNKQNNYSDLNAYSNVNFNQHANRENENYENENVGGRFEKSNEGKGINGRNLNGDSFSRNFGGGRNGIYGNNGFF